MMFYNFLGYGLTWLWQELEVDIMAMALADRQKAKDTMVP